MNLQPWLDGDEAAQEQEGYKDGQLHCKQGWVVDCALPPNPMDTPWVHGYCRGWDEAKAAGLHGTEPIKRDKTLPVWSDEYLEGLGITNET